MEQDDGVAEFPRGVRRTQRGDAVRYTARVVCLRDGVQSLGEFAAPGEASKVLRVPLPGPVAGAWCLVPVCPCLVPVPVPGLVLGVLVLSFVLRAVQCSRPPRRLPERVLGSPRAHSEAGHACPAARVNRVSCRRRLTGVGRRDVQALPALVHRAGAQQRRFGGGSQRHGAEGNGQRRRAARGVTG